MKNKLVKGLIIAGLVMTSIVTITLSSVNAESVYDDYAYVELSEDFALDAEYDLETMLNYAIQDEYLARAEYQAIITEFGEVMPFVRIIQAEENHIALLLGLFETYGFVVPEDNSADNVVIPESITSALATGVEAEEANIAMYQLFLAQEDLPEDVKAAFEYLMQASQHHLKAFSQDRYSYYGTDLGNKIRNQFQNKFGGGNQDQEGQMNQHKGGRGQGGQNQGQRSVNQAQGDCLAE